MPHRIVAALLSVVWLFLAALPAPAQDPNPAQALDADTITARITALEALETPDEDQKTELSELKSAVSLRQQAAASEANTSKLAAEASSASDQLNKAQADLEQAQADAEAPLVLDLPPAPTEGTADELRTALAPVEARLQSARAQEDAAQQVLDKARKDAADAEARSPAIPGEIAEATGQKEEVDPLVAGIRPDEDPSSLQEAKNTNLLARQSALAAKLAELDQELQTLEATKALRQVRIDLAQAHTDQAQRVPSAVQKELDARKLVIASRSSAEAEQASREAVSQHEVVRTILDQNAALASEREDVVKRQSSWNEQRGQVGELTKKWETTFERTRGQLGRVGLIDAMGLRLRNLRVQLRELNSYRDTSDEVWSEVKRAQSRSIELDKEVTEVPDARARRLVDASPEAVPANEREGVLQAAEAGLVSQEEFQKKLLASYEAYTDETLLGMHDDLERLADLGGEFVEYIQERILWVQSVAPIEREDLGRTRAAIVWIFGSDQWREVGAALTRHARQRPIRAVLLIVPLALLVGLQRFMRRRFQHYGKQVRHAATDHFAYTLGATVLTVLLALRLPAIFWALSRLLAGPDVTSEFAQACSAALESTLPVLLSVTLITELCRPFGLAAAHFGWSPETVSLVRLNLRVLGAFVVPTVFFLRLTETEAFHVHHDSLGRVAFCIGAVAFALFFWRVQHGAHDVLERMLTKESESWVTRTRPVWFPFLIVVPFGFGIAACSGFFLTARELSLRLLQSLWAVGAAVVLFHILVRGLYVAQRRLALAQAQRTEAKRRAAQEAGTEATSEPGPAPPTSPQKEEQELDVQAVNTQTLQMLGSALTVFVLVNLYFVWSAVLPALQVFEGIAVWTPSGAVATIAEDGRTILPPQAITLGDLGLALLIMLVTLQVARNIPGTLEILVLRRLPMSPGARYTTRTLVRYAIVILGALLTFDAIGIGWDKVQWMAAAVSVGLGFGMQEIFANFMSGLIILTERPIRLGDTVTVAGVSGTVERIQMRATTIADFNHKELIIPNKEFVTGSIVNWTLSSAITRVQIEIGLAHGSDTETAKRLMLEGARSVEDVLTDPGPVAFFIGFDSDCLKFELRIFIDDVDSLSSIRDKVNTRVDRAFREAGIEIAFRQHDVHVRSIAPLPFSRDGEPLGSPGAAGSGDSSSS